ncbi:hypothetical protein KJ068_22805 [bacterium]|nr:hypothetical protein [bacterium]
MDGLSSKIGLMRRESKREFKKVRLESAREFKKVRQESAKESPKLRQEMKQAFYKFEVKIQKQFATFGGMLLARIEAIEQNDAKLRNEILTMMDFVRKQYDEFHTEKTSLWAGQSRLKDEISRLKESDSDQNEAQSNLNVRVTQLEAA